MSAAIDLPTQIAAARRELEMRRRVYPHQVATKKIGQEKADAEIAAMEAIVRTLEWLYENEAKVKAKIAAAEPRAHTEMPSGRRYGQRCIMMLDFAKGGWEHHFEITDDQGLIVGTAVSGAKTRGGEQYRQYLQAGAAIYADPQAFLAAYEAGEWQGREPRADAAEVSAA